ncbi:MAG: MBL fold metallo-hydrolase [Solirubrobacterales bacterium]|nr:MBL fold metallo-hydrolase [Solirubrobacterales bacterium]MBV9717653.1 MBL fold metallo-hydrolase [Solirubrobacterales bacterium]
MSGLEAPAASADDCLVLAARAGIHRIPLPTPFLVGRVNCYLVEDEPLTLIDTGPNSGSALDELERGLAEHGRAIEDLGLIVLTHQHLDHVGLLEILVRRSGAEVAAFHGLGPYLEDFPHSATADDEFSHAIMRRHGVPEDLSTALTSVGAAFRGFGSRATVTQPLRDGDSVVLRDRALTVLHRPGHSPSDTLFWDERRRILIAGDHLLAHISSNPLVSRPLTGPTPSSGRAHALIQYIESMRATRELPARVVLTGHGDPVADPVALIDERLRMHQRRARKILGMLSRGPSTAYEIALRIWGNVAVAQAYLTLSEVLGHLDLLVAAGEAHEREDRDSVRFEAAPRR